MEQGDIVELATPIPLLINEAEFNGLHNRDLFIVCVGYISYRSESNALHITGFYRQYDVGEMVFVDVEKATYEYEY